MGQQILYSVHSEYLFCFLIWSCCCDLKIVTWASGKLNFAIANLYRSATHTVEVNIVVGCVITTWWLIRLVINEIYRFTIFLKIEFGYSDPLRVLGNRKTSRSDWNLYKILMSFVKKWFFGKLHNFIASLHPSKLHTCHA